MSFDNAVHQIDQELKTAHQHVSALEKAKAALLEVDGQTAPAPRRGRPAGSGNGRKRGRPAGSVSGGGRTQQALDLVSAQPGITIPQMADKMGIQPNYLYRVLPGLAKDGKVKRDGSGWLPA